MLNPRLFSTQELNIAVVLGIRSHIIKTAALQSAIHLWNLAPMAKINATYIYAGQHYDDVLAGQYLRELNVSIDVNLMKRFPNKSPIQMFAAMSIEIYKTLEAMGSKIDYVLTFGDANSSLAAAIAASKQRMNVVHIESGARWGDYYSSEEQNTKAIDHLSKLHFASSYSNLQNLEREGLGLSSYFSGDLVYDLIKQYESEWDSNEHNTDKSDYVLVTLHRDENVSSDEILKNILTFLNHYHKEVIFVAHPKTKRRLMALNLDSLVNVKIIDPLPHLKMLAMVRRSYFLITDSGTLQREAFYLKKRCLVRQDWPFWPFLIENRANIVLRTDPDTFEETFLTIEYAIKHEVFPTLSDFGTGNAGSIILERLILERGH